MPEVITDKESLEVLKEFFELYKEELKRESDQRSKQALIDTEQAEILAEEKVKDEKQAEIEAEQAIKEKEELIKFRTNLTSSIDKLAPIDYKSQFDVLDSHLQTIEKNTQSNESIENSSFYADITILFFLWFIFPAIFIYKSLNWFFSWM